jgi:uncharacterized protein YpbB
MNKCAVNNSLPLSDVQTLPPQQQSLRVQETCVQKSDTQKMSDAKLYQLCQYYGAQALAARRKFVGLLPEVARRHLYLKKGFGSIREFAAKLAGTHEAKRSAL